METQHERQRRPQERATENGSAPAPGPPPLGAPPRRRLSTRAAGALAAGTLALGIGVGAAIGPAPQASFAGDSPEVLAHLPQLLAAIAGIERARAAAQAARSSNAEASTQEASTHVRHRRHRRKRLAASTAASGASSGEGSGASSGEGSAASSGEGSAATLEGSSAGTAPTTSSKRVTRPAKLPATESVWLIELAGDGFEEALAQRSAAPYLTGTLPAQGTLLAGWSAAAASAFADQAALLAPIPAGGTPPLVHTIVQPPCPEGAAGQACSSVAGQLAAAEQFLKGVLAQISGTAGYREHGLVVITFATVAIAAQQGLPAETSSSTLTTKPPAGALLLSPFAKRGARPSTAYDPSSPARSLEALLG